MPKRRRRSLVGHLDFLPLRITKYVLITITRPYIHTILNGGFESSYTSRIVVVQVVVVQAKYQNHVRTPHRSLQPRHQFSTPASGREIDTRVQTEMYILHSMSKKRTVSHLYCRTYYRLYLLYISYRSYLAMLQLGLSPSIHGCK